MRRHGDQCGNLCRMSTGTSGIMYYVPYYQVLTLVRQFSDTVPNGLPRLADPVKKYADQWLPRLLAIGAFAC